MLAVRAGDIDQLGELFERYHRQLFAYLVRLTNDFSASEDLVQTTFQRVLQYRHTYREDGKFSTWLYHLARTCAADSFRKNRIIHSADTDGSLDTFAASTVSPANTVTLSDDLDMLNTALGSLPHEDREIIHLARIENRAHEDTARVLGCSVGAVKVRLHRALKLLRETYQKLCNETTLESFQS
jgi:RNA polymerase sigma-70 factor (ECF subfamily)